MYYAIVTYYKGGQYSLPELSRADTTDTNRRELARRMKRLCRNLLYTDYPVDLEIRSYDNDELIERWTQEKENARWGKTY